MKITAGQPPVGAGASGSVSVAARAVPSVDAILTSWREKAPAGPDAISAAAIASSTTSIRLATPVTAAKGSPHL